MTLVFARKINDEYVLFGDLLITGAVENKNPTPFFKTTENIRHNEHRENKVCVSGLKQKIHIINNKVVIGWCGSVLFAKNLIKEFVLFCSDKHINNETLNYFFSNSEIIKTYAESNLDVSCLILYKTNNKSFAYKWEPDAPISEDQPNDNDLVIGSGAPHFKQIIKIAKKSIIAASNSLPSNAEIYFYLSSLISSDLFSEENTTNFYGGFYEVCTFKNGRYQKLDNYEIILNEIRFTSPTKVFMPSAYVRYRLFYDTNLYVLCEVVNIDLEKESSDRESFIWEVLAITENETHTMDKEFLKNFKQTSEIQIANLWSKEEYAENSYYNVYAQVHSKPIIVIKKDDNEQEFYGITKNFKSVIESILEYRKLDKIGI